MNRKIAIGPERIETSLGVLDTYIQELKAHGAPEHAKIRIETLPSGDAMTVNVEYEEEVVSVADRPRRPQRENSGTEPICGQ